VIDDVDIQPGDAFNVNSPGGGYLRVTLDAVGNYRLTWLSGRGKTLYLRTAHQHSGPRRVESVKVIDDAECAVIYRKVVS